MLSAIPRSHIRGGSEGQQTAQRYRENTGGSDHQRTAQGRTHRGRGQGDPNVHRGDEERGLCSARGS